jgi:hypothetical protein
MSDLSNFAQLQCDAMRLGVGFPAGALKDKWQKSCFDSAVEEGIDVSRPVCCCKFRLAAQEQIFDEIASNASSLVSIRSRRNCAKLKFQMEISPPLSRFITDSPTTACERIISIDVWLPVGTRSHSQATLLELSSKKDC